jgi:two-component system nitrate/nitrite response regulator NarL
MLADSFEADDLVLQHDIGIDGFCLTTTSRDVLTKALDLALAGMSVFPTPMVLQMLEGFSSRAEADSKKRPLDYRGEAPISGGRELSRREAEILRCLMKGLPNKVISRELDVAEATVKVHVKAILRKIGARNRTQAAMWAAGHVLASPKVMAAVPAE